MLAAYHAVGPLLLPSNGRLYCWLDQEYSTSLSSAYWDAWAHYIAEYNFAGLGTYPLYPCLYCDPYSPYPNCSTIAKARGVDVPSAIWSSESESCGGLTNPPRWHPDECGDRADKALAVRRADRVPPSRPMLTSMWAARDLMTTRFCFYLSRRP